MHAPKKRNELAASILNYLSAFYTNINNPEIMKIYKERSAVLGKWVILIDGDKNIPAFVTDIKENGALCVELKSGEEKIVSSGEITLRFHDGKEI